MKEFKFSLESIIVQGKGNIVSDMDGEKVMLSIKNGKYYNLGEVGSVIWGFIESPITVKQLIISLMDNYEVEEKVCTEQVLSFLSSLLEENIIQVEEKVSL